MSMFYKVAYALGVAPWEQVHPRQAEQISALLDREEGERQPPYGPALDLGCGSGVWSVELARRGWQVTGVDNITNAVRRARTRAHDANVEVRFVHGDVTTLQALNIGSGYRFVLDFECFNHLSNTQRQAMGRAVGGVTTSGATMLLLTWAPARRGPLPPGAGRADIEAAYPDWTLLDEEPFDPDALPAPLKSTQPRFYRLRRN